jgi:hypothetical protein
MVAMRTAFPRTPQQRNGRHLARGLSCRIALSATFALILALVAPFVAETARADRVQKQLPHSKETLQSATTQEGIANAAGATAASAAQAQATRDGLPLRALSSSLLNSQLPSVTWVSGSSDAPYTATGKRIVAISMQGGHVMTAVEPYQGQCNFGMVVTSPSDPIIVRDHLHGPGTYGWNYLDTNVTRCRIAYAPKSWLPVKPQSLSSLSRLQRPKGGCTSSRSGDSVTIECPIKRIG